MNIFVKGTTTGTSTDQNGSYELTVKSLQDTLIFSFVGYQTRQVPIDGQTEINIVLQSQAISGEEMVVVGYSTQRKKDITGSVDVVDVETMRNIPTGSAEEALQGNASGVNVYNTGSPGENGNVFIRGVNSFGNSSPLVLIDGVEGKLSDVLPSNIESVQVLKDAGAAAIYGVRGSNGVILITTKKGKRDTPVSVAYDSYVGVQLPFSGNPYNLMNPQDQMKAALIANPDDPLYQNGMPDYLYVGPNGGGIAKEGSPVVDPSLYNLDLNDPSNTYLIAKVNKEGTNWYQKVYDPALVMNHNVNINGGTKDATYMFSLGYLNQEGTALNTYNKKYTVRANTEFYLNDNIRIGENLRVFNKDNPVLNSNSGSPYFGLAGIYEMMPLFPVFDIAGNYAGTRLGVGTGSRGNPYAFRDRAANQTSESRNALGDVFAEVDFLRNFTARTQVGVNYSTGYSSDFGYTMYEAAEGFSDNNNYSESSSYSTELKWTNTLTYKNLFAGHHKVEVLLGSEAIQNYYRGLSGYREEYFSTSFDYTSLSTGTSNLNNSSSKSKSTLFSLFADVNYSFNNKYLLGATIRRDGSSRFGKKTRYGIFPSFSVGWRISNESFMDGLNWVNELKLRGSYGVLGSQNNVSSTNQYSTYGGSFGTAYYPISGSDPQAGFIKERFGNPFTEWEKDKIINIGIDLALFRNFEMSVEYFKKTIEGLLFAVDLPATVGGATYPTVNIGNLVNTGVDLTLSYSSQFSRNWTYSMGANIGTYKNKVADVPDPGYFTTGNTQILNQIVRNQEGEAVSSFFGYDVVGLFQSEEDVVSSPTQTDAAPGLFKYRDVNRDGEITPDDRMFIGNPNPDLTYGLNLSIAYKDFDLSTNLYGSHGADLVNSIMAFTDFFGSYAASAKSNRLNDAWSKNNPNTSIPAIVGGSTFSTQGAMNSYFVEDGSYLKMRSLMLGFSTPSNVLQKFNIDKLRIYVQAKNLFTITNYSGLDPEIGGSSAGFGIDKGTYPGNERAYLVGIKLSF